MLLLLGSELGRRICVVSRWQARVNIKKLELIRATVRAANHIVRCRFRLFSHRANAHTADVRATAIRNQDVVEVAKTHGAVVLVDVALAGVEFVHVRDELFGDVCLDAHLVASADLVYSLLLSCVEIVGDFNGPGLTECVLVLWLLRSLV